MNENFRFQVFLKKVIRGDPVVKNEKKIFFSLVFLKRLIEVSKIMMAKIGISPI